MTGVPHNRLYHSCVLVYEYTRRLMGRGIFHFVLASAVFVHSPLM